MATLSKKNLSKVLLAVLILVMVGAIVLVALSVDGIFADAAPKITNIGRLDTGNYETGFSKKISAGGYIKFAFTPPSKDYAYDIKITAKTSSGQRIPIGLDTYYSNFGIETSFKRYNYSARIMQNYYDIDNEVVFMSTKYNFKIRCEFEAENKYRGNTPILQDEHIDKSYAFNMRVKKEGYYTITITAVKDKITAARQYKINKTTSVLRSRIWVNDFTDDADETAIIAYLNRDDIDAFCYSMNVAKKGSVTTGKAMLGSIYNYTIGEIDNKILEKIALYIPKINYAAAVLSIFTDFIDQIDVSHPLFSNKTFQEVTKEINTKFKNEHKWNSVKGSKYEWDHGIKIVIKLHRTKKYFYATVKEWDDTVTYNKTKKRWNTKTFTYSGLSGQSFDFEEWGDCLAG